MAIPYATGRHGIERITSDCRQMTVNVFVLEDNQFFESAGIQPQDAADIHEFGKADRLRVVCEILKALSAERGPRCFKRGCRYAGGQLDQKVHDCVFGTFLEIGQGWLAKNIRYFVRVTYRCCRPARKNAAVELHRCDQRALDMNVRIDKAGNGGQSLPIDYIVAVILGISPGDGLIGYRDIGFPELAGYKI